MPKELAPRLILKEPNPMKRELMIERYGLGRLVSEAGEAINVSRDGILFVLWLPQERQPCVMVEVTCPSTGKKYRLRVPPQTLSVRAAVAWTFGLQPRQYCPKIET